MPVQNARDSNNLFDETLSSVVIDGKQVLHFAPGEEPWTATPQGDMNSSSADSFGSGVDMVKNNRAWQFTLNTTAFDDVYQDLLKDPAAYGKTHHTIDAVNQLESFHTDIGMLPRPSTVTSGNTNANRAMSFNTNNGTLKPAPK
ncbi:hypothetical protein [Apilactobacillus micheneri]|uniref:hypothetical protein n=1 Tax=Apilactobacillus micheneri TaxID=1899430 RepID=UPI000D0424F9|nr:hypothetical protein [Apilactobacillus micheneri]